MRRVAHLFRIEFVVSGSTYRAYIESYLFDAGIALQERSAR